MSITALPVTDGPLELGAFALAHDVIILPVDDGSARLLDLDGDFYALPPPGAAMLRAALAEGIEPAIRRVAAEYGVEASRVRADCLALLGELGRRGLVRAPGECRGARPLRAVVARAVIGVALRVLGLLRGRDIHTAALLLWARSCFALFGWAETVRAWIDCIKPNEALAPPRHDAAIAAMDESVRRWATRLPFTACKERALCCWYVLCSAGIPATLVVGVQLFPFSGHCWCEAGARVLTDFADRCEAFTPIARYEARRPPAGTAGS